jgi:chaperonin cofactor prefoldin
MHIDQRFFSRHTSTVAVLQVELQRAQHDLVRWKRTQESAQYERASPATRIILDRNRAMFNLRVQEAKRRLDRALSTLIDLPDFARSRKTPGTILTKETIAAYTAELKDWFSDLELHKRTLIEKEKADLPPAPVEGTSVEPQLTVQQLVERGKCTWNDIRNVTNELDTRILTAAEHLYSDVYTTIADFKEQAAGLQDPRPVSLSASTKTRENQYGALSSTANLVGDNLSVQATRAAELISKIHTLEQEHEQLQNETRAMNKFCAEVI